MPEFGQALHEIPADAGGSEPLSGSQANANISGFISDDAGPRASSKLVISFSVTTEPPDLGRVSWPPLSTKRAPHSSTRLDKRRKNRAVPYLSCLPRQDSSSEKRVSREIRACTAPFYLEGDSCFRVLTNCRSLVLVARCITRDGGRLRGERGRSFPPLSATNACLTQQMIARIVMVHDVRPVVVQDEVVQRGVTVLRVVGLRCRGGCGAPCAGGKVKLGHLREMRVGCACGAGLRRRSCCCRRGRTGRRRYRSGSLDACKQLLNAVSEVGLH